MSDTAMDMNSQLASYCVRFLLCINDITKENLLFIISLQSLVMLVNILYGKYWKHESISYYNIDQRYQNIKSYRNSFFILIKIILVK